MWLKTFRPNFIAVEIDFVPDVLPLEPLREALDSCRPAVMGFRKACQSWLLYWHPLIGMSDNRRLGVFDVSFVVIPTDIDAVFRQVEVPKIVMLHGFEMDQACLRLFLKLSKLMNGKGFFDSPSVVSSSSQELAWNLY